MRRAQAAVPSDRRHPPEPRRSIRHIARQIREAAKARGRVAAGPLACVLPQAATHSCLNSSGPLMPDTLDTSQYDLPAGALLDAVPLDSAAGPRYGLVD